jgi:hypothetical protein
VVTHKAQHHRDYAGIFVDFALYVNQQIVTTNYMVGERSISIHFSGHSGRCIVMLGCSASGCKFPVFVIWKGVPNDLID